MQRPYVLGLDLGVSSIGWAIAPLSDNKPADIEALGTFCYPSPIAEVENGRRVTNRSNRGARRRARHRLDHFQARRKRLVNLLASLGWWPNSDPTDPIRHRKVRASGDKVELCHPVALKVKGLTEPLEPYDLGVIFLHYQRHRGYLSTADLPALLQHKRPTPKAKKADAKAPAETAAEEELRKLSDQIGATRKLLNGQFISQVQMQQLDKRKAIRATKIKELKDGKLKDSGKLRTSLRYDRWMYIEEFDELWKVQAEHHPEMTDDLRDQIRALVFHQLPLESKDHLVGKCEYLPTYRRCRKGELVFQRSRILQFLGNLKLRVGGQERPLTAEERKAALEVLIVNERLSWAELRTAIQIGDAATFTEEPRQDRKKKIETKRDFVQGSAWGQAVSRALQASGEELARGDRDAIVHDLIELPVARVYERLTTRYGLSDANAISLMGIELQKKDEGYANLCSRVLRRIEPHLLAGLNLHDALGAAGYKQRPIEIRERIVIEPGWTTLNPSVDAAVRWSAKVINQIIDRHGKPAVIRVELPRQMAMGNEARAEEWLRINKQEKERAAIAKMLEEEGIAVNRKNIQKVLLWKEAGKISPYEPGLRIDLADLMANYEIDHIVPQSYAAEDGFANLTICSAADNAAKASQTPYEAFAGDKERWERIQVHVAACVGMSPRKRARILATERPEQAMEARMIVSVGYVGRQMGALLKTLGVDCQFVNGQITAETRRLYGVNTLLGQPKTGEAKETKRGIGNKEEFAGEKDRSDLRHHAIDAAMVCLVDLSLAQRLTRYFKAKEAFAKYRTAEKAERPTLEAPFPVRDRLQQLLPSIPVVRPPNRGVSGALHKESMEPLAEFKGLRGPKGAYRAEGRYVLRYDSEGNVSGAWLKGEVHHGLVYRLSSGKLDIRSVSLFEASERRAKGENVIDPLRDAPKVPHRFVMSLSGGDIVEYVGDNGAGPGYYRIGTIAIGKQIEVSLIWILDARSNPKATGSVRLRSGEALKDIARRVVLNAFGEVVHAEPTADD